MTGSDSSEGDADSDESNDDFLVPKKVQPTWNDEEDDKLMNGSDED